jgi:hypothetical protein
MYTVLYNKYKKTGSMQVKTSLYCHYLNATVPAQDFSFFVTIFFLLLLLFFTYHLAPCILEMFLFLY